MTGADELLDTIEQIRQEKFTDLDGTVLVELRGTGGLTVYPPSTHKDTGEQIDWHTWTQPAEVALTDLQQAVAKSRRGMETSIVAMTDHGQAYDYTAVVGVQISDERIKDYARAADFLNAGHFDVEAPGKGLHAKKHACRPVRREIFDVDLIDWSEVFLRGGING